MKWRLALATGFSLALLLGGCGARRPTVPPVPAPLIGSCYQLAYTPLPPPVNGWAPPDTAHFLSVRYAETIDVGEETNGHLSRVLAPTGHPRQADWWVSGKQIYIAYRTLGAERLLKFDSLTSPGLGRWRQTGHGVRATGTVAATPIHCVAAASP
jgi:hypothetical protein